MTERDESYGAGLAELMNPEVARNPQPIYSMLQASTPVFRLDGVGVIVASRSGVDEVLRNPDVFSSSTTAHDMKTKRPLIPLQIDPPDHRTYRKLLDPLFAPARMRLLEESTTRLVNDLIDGFIDEEEIDFARQFSTPFPSQVFLTLFGLPMADLPVFLKMKDGAIRPDQVVGHELGHPETEAYQQETADSIYAYFERVIDERERFGEARTACQRHVRDDLLSHFLTVEVDGDRLSHEEILDICFLFLIAGLDTVTASLDCFFGYLVDHPETRRTLAEEPDMIPAMVEELLRWETPVMGTARVATRDTELEGFAISEGEQVMSLLGAANVDEAEFADAGQLVWDREANRHLAFGGGVHRCLGSHLARLELRVALREWHRRIPEYRIEARGGAQLHRRHPHPRRVPDAPRCVTVGPRTPPAGCLGVRRAHPGGRRRRHRGAVVDGRFDGLRARRRHRRRSGPDDRRPSVVARRRQPRRRRRPTAGSRRPQLLRRYLALEGHRALAANEAVLPPAVRRLIDGGVAARLDDRRGVPRAGSEPAADRARRR